MSRHRDSSERIASERFATTRWSIVSSAARDSSLNSSEALESLCEAYWFPLYAYVRKRVASVDEAKDLTQAFFSQLLEKNYVAAADPTRGRFRSFLITAFKHFISKEWEKSRAKKRGGDHAILSLDFQDGDSRIANEPVDELTADQIYEQQWAITILDRVINRLRIEYEESGKANQFEHLKEFIIQDYSDRTYADVAEALGSTEAAMKMSAFRMRQRYREILREEIADVVAEPEDIEDEIRNLFGLFRR